MTEYQIDEFLVQTRRTAEKLISDGRVDLGLQVLATGSTVANFALSVLRLPTNKVYCPTCHRQLKTGVQIEFLKMVGVCHSCDHIEGEVLEQYDLN